MSLFRANNELKRYIKGMLSKLGKAVSPPLRKACLYRCQGKQLTPSQLNQSVAEVASYSVAKPLRMLIALKNSSVIGWREVSGNGTRLCPEMPKMIASQCRS